MRGHVNAQTAKQFKITRKDKKLWHSMVIYVKKKLKERYYNVSEEMLLKDISFSHSPKVKRCLEKYCHSPKNQVTKCSDNETIIEYCIGSDILRRWKSVDEQLRREIDEQRLQRMCHISKYMSSFAIILAKSRIKTLFNMPIVVNRVAYFVDVYLPEWDIAVDIQSSKSQQTQIRGNKTVILRSVGIKRIKLEEYEACHPNIAIKIKRAIMDFKRKGI